MKTLIFLLCFSSSVLAAPTSLDLQRVGLADFCRLVFSEVLQKSYVLDVPVVSDNDLFSVTLRNLSPGQLESEARRVLKLRGYKVDDSAGVLVVSKLAKEPEVDGDKEVFVYRPSFRSVQYLLSLAESMFKPGSFVGRRQNQPIGFNQLSGGHMPGGHMLGGVVGAGSSVFQSVGAQPSGAFDQGLNQSTNVEQDVIVFNGAAVDIGRLKKIFASVDTPVGELLVKAVVLEIQRSNRQGSAVDFVTSVLKSGIGLNVAAGAADTGANVFFKFKGSGFDFSAVYSALSSDNRFKILTSPRVRVKSDSTARFTVGNETPVLASVSYDGNGKAIQNVEYKSSGVIFELKPKIRAAISELHVSQQISQFVATTNGVNQSPTLTKRELSTDVLVTDGDLILLGGLDDEKSTGNSFGLSFLPKFLHAVMDEETKTEIVLMLNIDRVSRSFDGI